MLGVTLSAWYGWIVAQLGDWGQTTETWERGLALAAAASHFTGRPYLRSKLGLAADEVGDHQRATRYHHETREMFVKSSDPGGEGYTLSRLSWMGLLAQLLVPMDH